MEYSRGFKLLELSYEKTDGNPENLYEYHKTKCSSTSNKRKRPLRLQDIFPSKKSNDVGLNIDIDYVPNGNYESRNSDGFDYYADEDDVNNDNFKDIGAFAVYTGEGGIENHCDNEVDRDGPYDEEEIVDSGNLEVFDTCVETENDVDFIKRDHVEAIKELNKELLEVKALENDFDKEFLTNAAVEVQHLNIDKEQIVPEQEVVTRGGKSSKKRQKCKNNEKHPMRDPCSEKCRRKCNKYISQERRIQIYNAYWRKAVELQREFLIQRVNKVNKERSRSRNNTKLRNSSRKYTFKSEDGDIIQVCSKNFLGTLGYANEHVISWVFNNLEEKAVKDRRGCHEPVHKMPSEEVDLVIRHIESFHPAISHYRRAHAPLRRYLPPSLSVQTMHTCFLETYPNINCCYQVYRRIFHAQNIGFTKLGEEECEVCETHRQHDCSSKYTDKIISAKDGEAEEGACFKQIDESNCDVCVMQDEHLIRADLSRKMYRKDVENNKDPSKGYYSMDMQKIIMLPHMPGIKTALFTRRILMINQTIAPLGGKKHSKGKPQGFLWHEAIQGRNDEDVASVVIKFLRSNAARDYSEVTLWCDNCSGQNKNWTLFSAIAHLLLDPANHLDVVTLHFFEKGHTFMSADSFHHTVEEEIRKKKFLYDFQDFVDCVKERGTAVEMLPRDFYDYKNEKGSAKDIQCPLLRSLSIIRFRKESTKIYWKEKFDDKDFKESEFLKKKTRQAFIKWKPCPGKGGARGITHAKKEEILHKLSGFMEGNRLKIWKEITSHVGSKDLTINIEHLSKDE